MYTETTRGELALAHHQLLMLKSERLNDVCTRFVLIEKKQYHIERINFTKDELERKVQREGFSGMIGGMNNEPIYLKLTQSSMKELKGKLKNFPDIIDFHHSIICYFEPMLPTK